VKGHLHLVCARNGLGDSYLREQSFRAPIHLSKPHEDAGALVVNMVNPTAGIFDDDSIDVSLAVEGGAHMVVTTPSSSRVYRSRNGKEASVRQKFSVREGGTLEFFPEPFIPHAGARYRQHNLLEVGGSSVLVFFEWLTPGRVASGECFAYQELNWETDVVIDGKLAARERYRLKPGDDSLKSLKLISPEAHYLACFVVGVSDFPHQEVEALGGEGVFLGSGALCHGGWVVKAICANSLLARRTLGALRGVVYQALGRKLPTLGRF